MASAQPDVTDDAAPLLEVRNLVVQYSKNSPPAVNDVSFTIARGETVGLVGESGSGKTTIGKAILGLQAVTSGQILFEGVDITHASPAKRRELHGDLRAVFQDPYSSLNPRRPIGDAIGQPLRVAGVPRDERDARVADSLEAVGLDRDAGTRMPRQFSGGQRQRIAIARALVTDPRLVVCDEAVSALDQTTRAQVLRLFARLSEGRDLGYLFIAHDMPVVEFLAQRVIVLYRGQIMEEGLSSQVINEPRNPYTRVLMAASPVADPDEQARRRTEWRKMREQWRAETGVVPTAAA